MFWHKYPLTDLHELNLDYILAMIRDMHKEISEFEAVNKITNAGAWDITKQYQAWTIVSDNNVGYISLKPVPAGVAITNTDYWGVIADYDILITDLSNRISALEETVDYMKVYLTPEMYGAVGDGVTDDQFAISTMFVDCATYNKDAYFTTGKTYAHSDVIGVPTGVKMFGGGTLKGTDETKCAIVLNGDNIIEGIVIDNVATTRQHANASMGILVDGENCLVNKCHIKHNSAAGILVNYKNCRVTNNHIENNLADGIHFTHEADNGVATGNYCYNTGDDGIAVVAYQVTGHQVENVLIDNNIIIKSNARGVGCIGGRKVTITNNIIEDSAAAGIRVAQEGAYTTYFPSDVIISNNTVSKTTARTTEAGAIEIYNILDPGAATIGKIVVSNNNIPNSTSAGVYMEAVENVNVSGNSILNTTWGCIEINNRIAGVDQNNKMVKIDNNICRDCGAIKVRNVVGFSIIGNNIQNATQIDGHDLGVTYGYKGVISGNFVDTNCSVRSSSQIAYDGNIAKTYSDNANTYTYGTNFINQAP